MAAAAGPRNAPPFSGGLSYWRHDAKNWQRANRATWSTQDLETTVRTIWSGDGPLRVYYNAVINTHTLPGFPPHITGLPQVPYQPADQLSAKINKVVPPPRTAPPGGAPPPVPALPVAPIPPPVAIPPAPIPPPAAIAPPVPAHPYPFSFWPPLPWHAEPDAATDPTRTFSAAEFRTNGRHLNLWLSTQPLIWNGGSEDKWKGARRLGGQGSSFSGLWCRVDDNNNIDKRMVIKETRPTPSEWRDPMLWRSNLPREIQVHKMIDSQRPANSTAGYDNLVEHEGYRLMMRQRRFRLYHEYYEGGTLADAVWDHFRSRYNPQEPADDNHWNYQGGNQHDAVLLNSRGDPPGYLPEYFIWYVFGSLVNACQILRSGQVANAPGGVAQWQPVTHLDINLRNILLQPIDGAGGTQPDIEIIVSNYATAIYPMTTTALPAGAAPDEAHHYEDNPMEYLLFDTKPQYAPELQKPRDDGHPPYQLDEKTDLWQIGATIWTLMTNGRYGSFGEPEFASSLGILGHNYFVQKVTEVNQKRMSDAPDPWPADRYPTINHYSNDLKRLVRRCLNWHPPDRPLLVDAHNIITTWLNNHPYDPFEDTNFLLKRRDDLFEMGEPRPNRLSILTIP